MINLILYKNRMLVIVDVHTWSCINCVYPARYIFCEALVTLYHSITIVLFPRIPWDHNFGTEPMEMFQYFYSDQGVALELLWHSVVFLQSFFVYGTFTVCWCLNAVETQWYLQEHSKITMHATVKTACTATYICTQVVERRP